MSDYDAGWAATWEVMDDAALGTGIVFDPKRVSLVNLYRSQPGPSGHHLLAVSATDKNGKIAYAAGYGWSKAGAITSPEKWTEYLAAFKL